MKPSGPIPADFVADGGELVLGGQRVCTLLGGATTPCFVYDVAIVRDRIVRLRNALPADVSIHYAVKANPFRPLLAAIQPLVDGFDVASRGEAQRAAETGMGRDHISFAGPGKGDDEIEAALRYGLTLNLESEGEADRMLAIAARFGQRPRAAVRVNPDFEVRASGLRMGGGAKPFGVDAARVPALVRRLVEAGVDYGGLHVFAGSQSLDAAALAETQRQTVALVGRLSDEAGAPPPLVNLGGGFGVPYFDGDQPLDVEAVGVALGETLAARPAVLAETRFALELGRWLVAECGVYLVRILDRKQNGGTTFLVTDGGLHHQLAASGNFGTVVRRNYPLAIANRFDAARDDEVTVVGRLCTPMDRLGDAVLLPRAEPGDVAAMFLAGAYGYSASPRDFLGHPDPQEILVDSDRPGATASG